MFVSDDPLFAISRVPDFGQPIYEKSQVSLRCEVNSNPPSTPRWIKHDDQVPVSCIIILRNRFRLLESLEYSEFSVEFHKRKKKQYGINYKCNFHCLL